MALDFERARQVATRGLRALVNVPAGIEREHGQEGPPIEVRPYAPGEFSPGAQVTRAALALMSGARARANYRRQQEREGLQDEYARTQLSVLRKKLAGEPTYEVDLGGKLGKVRLTADQLSRYRVGLARAQRPPATRSRAPAAAGFERSLDIEREGSEAEGMAKARQAGEQWRRLALQPRPGVTTGGASDRVHAARVLGIDPSYLEAYDKGDATVRQSIDQLVAGRVQGFVDRWMADYRAKLSRDFGPRYQRAARVKAEEAGIDLDRQAADEEVQDDRNARMDALIEALQGYGTGE